MQPVQFCLTVRQHEIKPYTSVNFTQADIKLRIHTPDLHKNRYLCPVKLLTEAASYQQFCKMLQE